MKAFNSARLEADVDSLHVCDDTYCTQSEEEALQSPQNTVICAQLWLALRSTPLSWASQLIEQSQAAKAVSRRYAIDAQIPHKLVDTTRGTLLQGQMVSQHGCWLAHLCRQLGAHQGICPTGAVQNMLFQQQHAGRKVCLNRICGHKGAPRLPRLQASQKHTQQFTDLEIEP